MPWQLIYTSAPRGLASGHTGFCTVARSADLREALAQRLEQLSSYHYLHPARGEIAGLNPTISAYRILDVRGSKYHLLSRLEPAGLDFTARTNHLAQHLVFQDDELSLLPSPAAILRHWHGWRQSWEGDPRLLPILPKDSFRDVPAHSWPACTWERLTGDAGRAAGLLEGECARGCYLLCLPGHERDLLELFVETLQLLDPLGQDPKRPWQHTFTTFIQGEDTAADFQWRGCQKHTPAWEQATRRSVRILALQDIPVPNNSSARLARDGPKSLSRPKASLAPRSAPTSLTLQRPGSTRPTTGSLTRETRGTAGPARLTRSLAVRIGIACALLLGLVALKFFWQNREPSPVVESAASVPKPDPKATVPPIEPSPNTREQITPTVAQSPPAPSALRPSANLEKLWPAVATSLMVVPALSNVVSLEGMGPLNALLRQYDRLDLLVTNIEMLAAMDTFDFTPSRRLTLEPPLSTRKLSATGPNDLRVTFDYSSGLANADRPGPVALQVAAAKPSTTLSILFRPSPDAEGKFEPFRLLIVSENAPPPALLLSKRLINANGRTLDDMLRPPLHERLLRTTLIPAHGWQLRPFVQTKKGGLTALDLYASSTSGAQPPPGTELDFAAAKGRIEAGLLVLSNRVVALNTETEQLAANIQKDVDLNLPLGHWFGATNDPLKSVHAFKGHAALSPDLYLRYLEQLTQTTAPRVPWLSQWSLPSSQDREAVAKKLQDLYDLCRQHFPPEPAAKLTLDGPTTNYFLAVWLNLKSEEDQKAREQNRQKCSEEISRLKRQLEQWPSSLEDIAYLSLFVQGPSQRVEVIRFAGPADNLP